MLKQLLYIGDEDRKLYEIYKKIIFNNNFKIEFKNNNTNFFIGFYGQNKNNIQDNLTSLKELNNNLKNKINRQVLYFLIDILLKEKTFYISKTGGNFVNKNFNEIILDNKNFAFISFKNNFKYRIQNLNNVFNNNNNKTVGKKTIKVIEKNDFIKNEKIIISLINFFKNNKDGKNDYYITLLASIIANNPKYKNID